MIPIDIMQSIHTIIQWVKNYLQNRMQKVKIFNVTSDFLPVTSGIPQGSLFGPFLFNTVVGSHRPIHRRTKVAKYIDDCTFIMPLSKAADESYLVEHNNMLSWSSAHGLKLNLGKCKFLWIPKSLNYPPPFIPEIVAVTDLKLLGVYFTADLKWHKHIDYINKCASRRLYALRVLKPVLSHRQLLQVYHGLILSVMEYCSPLLIGMHVKDEDVLEKIQRRAHRIICGDSRCSCGNFPNLHERRKKATLNLLSKISSNPSHPLHGMCPSRSLLTNRLIVPQTLTARRRNSFFPMATILTNNVFVQ